MEEAKRSSETERERERSSFLTSGHSSARERSGVCMCVCVSAYHVMLKGNFTKTSITMCRIQINVCIQEHVSLCVLFLEVCVCVFVCTCVCLCVCVHLGVPRAGSQLRGLRPAAVKTSALAPWVPHQ